MPAGATRELDSIAPVAALKAGWACNEVDSDASTITSAQTFENNFSML